jgi:hypothetical protein
LALPERVDFLAQRGSLSTQIARTYLRITGRGGDPGLLKEQMFVAVAASVAASIVAELVSPERLLELLQTGRPADVVPNTRPIAGGLSPQSLGNAWRAYLNSESGTGRFFPGCARRQAARRAPSSSILSAQPEFCLRSRTWCGIEPPEPLLVAIGQTRKVGLSVATLMADSGAGRLRACGAGSEPDDQSVVVQRPRRSVDNNISSIVSKVDIVFKYAGPHSRGEDSRCRYRIASEHIDPI